MQDQNNQQYPKLVKKRLTGMFRKEGKYGTFYTGNLEDGTQLVLSPPFQREGEEPNPKGPAFVLSVLVPAEEVTEPKE